jgi:hypothetical protein
MKRKIGIILVLAILDLLRYKTIKIAAFCSLLSSSHIPSFCGSPLFALSQIIPQQVYYYWSCRWWQMQKIIICPLKTLQEMI